MQPQSHVASEFCPLENKFPAKFPEAGNLGVAKGSGSYRPVPVIPTIGARKLS
jgi:hypothetical protein